MVNAGEDWAEGIFGKAKSNQGGSVASPPMPTGFGDWHLVYGLGAMQLSLGASGTWVIGLQEHLLNSSETSSLGCEKSVW